MTLRWHNGRRHLLLLALLAMATSAKAEVAWIGESAVYEITGGQLFALREELPPDLQESLKALRNLPFANEAAFSDALHAALLTNSFRAEWTARLEAEARQTGVAYGIEPRQGNMLSLYISGASHELDGNAFTAQSWLDALPEPRDAGPLAAEFDAGCLNVRHGNVQLFSLCHGEVSETTKSVVLRSQPISAKGLGQEFMQPGDTSVDRLGKVRTGLNQMSGFNGGANGNTLFPIAYFDHPGRPFALILDNRYAQRWDFSDPEAIRISVAGGELRLHVIAGATLADIRRDYMAMTGFPPVPPKAAFGLWISEYGYDDWAELEDKIATLTANGFPLSGVVMDLQWFGGIASASPQSRMGTLSWDHQKFPDPEGKIAELAQQDIAMMLIEESYISSGLEEFAALGDQGFLAHDAAGAPLIVNANGNWWGLGGMIDWTSPDAGKFWHDFRRQALIDAGIAAHWTDLGEPEMFNAGFLYSDGLSHEQVHNSYNLYWLESIADGYRRNAPERRPFMMARSGGMGMQALGAAMWSGDTGSDFGSLAAQMGQQAHMMWSGLDYYGSDVGGFHRGALSRYEGDRDAAMDELYTQWFAYSAMFEVPVRPHTENLCNCKETAPDRIGDLDSNRENIALRYRLLPYYYSLAHQAFRTGEAVIPTLDYWFPDEPLARELGHVKMVGSQMISAAVAEQGATEVEVYLPRGAWYDFHSHERIVSEGEFFSRSLDDSGLFRLPLLVRDGGIVPTTDEEGNAIAVFGSAVNRFDWYDDDGKTTGYQRGEYDHVAIDVWSDTLTLERLHGSAVDPGELIWVRPDAASVSRVLIDGEEVSFTQNGSALRVELPRAEERLTVEVER